MDAEGTAASVGHKIHNYELEVASYKEGKSFPEAKKGIINRMSLEHFNLADLSPTTGDVPVSDEYKVEWVKAKAEFKRKKSAAFTADVCDPSQKSCGPTVAFALQSSDSAHSSDSGQSLNESAHSYESSLSQETRSNNKPEQLEGSGISSKLDETPASDDVKSTVAAMKSIFERDAKLRSVSDKFSFGSNENLSFGTTLKSSHSSASLTKTEKKEFGAFSSADMNVMEKQKK
ncbi:hypothetical protein E2C01_002076 [Portunus trituberculatus]|uniref:Uncharacterized protein n=1 Tax=Portunus trituberculatus TaxID=210409 RepID=A0A5B7CL60_PORTR|nr:hypothetical protein [Portunus trituberculatus]